MYKTSYSTCIQLVYLLHVHVCYTLYLHCMYMYSSFGYQNPLYCIMNCTVSCTICFVETSEQSQKRLELLISLGDCVVEQGQWHLAAKKYTQAGNRIKVDWHYMYTCTCTI